MVDNANTDRLRFLSQRSAGLGSTVQTVQIVHHHHYGSRGYAQGPTASADHVYASNPLDRSEPAEGSLSAWVSSAVCLGLQHVWGLLVACTLMRLAGYVTQSPSSPARWFAW